MDAKKDFFEELADALWSWKIDISGDKKELWMKYWDIILQTREYLGLVVTFLEWKKSHDYAKGFKAKFQKLYDDVKDFYEKLEQNKFSKEEIFHEQIPILESEAKQLAEHVLKVRCLYSIDIDKDKPTPKKPEETEQKKKGILRRLLKIIVAIVGFLAAMFTCLGYLLGWLGPIKAFIVKILWPK